MNLMVDLILWMAPFIVVLAGLGLSRIKAMRSQRYVFYAVILFIAFLIDLNSLKFSNFRLDIALSLSVTLIVSEFFWRMVRSRNKVFFTTSLVIGILIFGYQFRQWIISGPVNASYLWESQVASEHSTKDAKYKLIEPFKMKYANGRTFKLYKCLKYLPMEKFMEKYTTPQGYERAEFSFRWYIKNGAVMVDIIGNSDTLWTLKEGILE